MLIPKKVVETVDAATVEIHAKVCDAGHYTLKGPNGERISRRDDYVPSFFPGDHYGDYIILEVELDSGIIKNWKRPDPADVATAFGMTELEE